MIKILGFKDIDILADTLKECWATDNIYNDLIEHFSSAHIIDNNVEQKINFDIMSLDNNHQIEFIILGYIYKLFKHSKNHIFLTAIYSDKQFKSQKYIYQILKQYYDMTKSSKVFYVSKHNELFKNHSKLIEKNLYELNFKTKRG